MADPRLVSVVDFERQAERVLPRSVWDYYRSGAGQEDGLAMNTGAFRKLRIRPSVLRDVSRRDLSVMILGRKVPVPIGVAPTAMQAMAHPDGECANARGAGAAGAIFTLSAWSNKTIEEVAAAAPDTVKWQHVHIFSDRSMTQRLVARAERVGFQAVVVTVDTPLISIRYADIRNQFQLPAHLSLANFKQEEASINDAQGMAHMKLSADEMILQSQTWEDIKWLKSITELPIVVKGILTAEDAVIAADVGVAAIQVSNHGSRQLDGLPAPIEALPEIVRAVGGRCEVYLDGGVRQGTDVFRALALGAKMVFVGRPALWGLAAEGEQGVTSVLRILTRELDHTLALSGCTCVQDIEPGMVMHKSRYSRL